MLEKWRVECEVESSGELFGSTDDFKDYEKAYKFAEMMHNDGWKVLLYNIENPLDHVEF